MTHEFLITHIPSVIRFVNSEIGVEYDASYSDDDPNRREGSLTVFDLSELEHQAIRNFITEKNLWSA